MTDYSQDVLLGETVIITLIKSKSGNAAKHIKYILYTLPVFNWSLVTFRAAVLAEGSPGDNLSLSVDTEHTSSISHAKFKGFGEMCNIYEDFYALKCDVGF